MRGENLTTRVQLAGGQDRLRQAILYVAERNSSARYFGRVKLNKILWRADFKSFKERGVPVTGRMYQREKFGPVPNEMLPLYREMGRLQQISEIDTDFGDGVTEHRPVAQVAANMALFTEDDVAYLDESISHYWDLTGQEASDASHGAAWKSRNDGDAMPYESVYLSDDIPGPRQLARLRAIAEERRIYSR